MAKRLYSQFRFLAALLLTLGGGLGAFAGEPAQAPDPIRLPDLGSPSDKYLTPADEVRLGKAFMRNIRTSQHVITDPLIAQYIQNLGNRLLKHSEAAAQPFDFFVIESPTVNAFAGPGGHIGVFSGLILTTQSESELASVIAHEIAHVTQKHLLRAFDAASRMSAKTAALILASILVGAATSSPDAGFALASSAQASALQQQINFTRNDEQEADTVGIRTLASAGFDPRAMPTFFERLTHADRLYDSGIPEILRTHPVTTNRIADALNRAAAYPYRQYTSDFRYYLVREALRVRQFASPKSAVEYFEKSLKEGRYLNKEAQRYGYALALTERHHYRRAGEIMDQLLKQRPQQAEYVLARARIYQQTEQPELALRLLETNHLVTPDSYPLSVAYIEALLQSGRADRAKEIINQARSLRPNDPRLFRLLGKAEEQLGNSAESHRLLAEAYVADGRLNEAVEQLKIAVKNDDKGDFYLSSRIESRLKELKRRLARQEEKESH